MFQELFKPSLLFVACYMFSVLNSFSFFQSFSAISNPHSIYDNHNGSQLNCLCIIIGPCYFARYSTHQALVWGTSSNHQQSTTHNQIPCCSLWSLIAELTCQRSQVRMPKEKQLRPVPSRQWSCSEMVDGHRKLVAAKEERESDDELNQRIQDGFCWHIFKPVRVIWYSNRSCDHMMDTDGYWKNKPW